MSKIRLFYLVVSAILALSFYSCQEEEDMQQDISAQGYVKFSTAISANSQGRLHGDVSKLASHITLSFQRLEGDSTVETKDLKIYNFNGQWLSDQLMLEVGHYKLSQFFVSDSANNVLYATPITGSKLAHMVKSPLSVEFIVSPNQETSLVLEVVNVAQGTPEEFGYATFSFEVVEYFPFDLGALIYSDTINKQHLTTFDLTVLGDGNLLYQGWQDAKINNINVKDGYNLYELILRKEGYDSLYLSYGASELKEHTKSNRGALTPAFINITHQEPSKDSSLIAYYPFWNGAQDMSFNQYNTDLYGATATTDRWDSLNNAYSFDGVNDYIAMRENMSITNQVTVTAWIKTTDSSAMGSFIASKYNWKEDKGFHLYVKNGSAGFAGRDGYNTYLRTEADQEIYSVADGNWHHIVGICNKNVWQLWIDGRLAKETSYPTHSRANINSVDPFTIGNFYQGSGEGYHGYFEGAIDNVRVYNSVLSEQEIKHLYADYL